MSRHNRERRQQHYDAAVLKTATAALASGRLKPGTLHTVEVLHDDWCNLLAGRGACDCEPVVGAIKPIDLPRGES